MATRTAHARWEGGLKQGKGQVKTQSGALRAAYSFSSRFEEGTGTNPEELLGAAHAGCFAMALTLMLEEAGHSPESVDAEAAVTIEPADGGFRITRSQLTCQARVPGLDEAAFQDIAEKARAGCPVSQALGAIEIGLEARLRS